MTPGTNSPPPLPKKKFDSSETWAGVSPYTFGTSERCSPRHIAVGVLQATEGLREFLDKSMKMNWFGD